MKAIKTLCVYSSLVLLIACGEKDRPTQHSTAPAEPPKVQRPTDNSYVGFIKCGMQGPNGLQHINVLACFAGGRYGGETELELRNGQQYGLYKAYNLMNVGQETPEGFRIELESTFEVTVQNSNDSLILGLDVVGAQTGNIYFQKQVSKYGVIKVSN